MLENDFAKQGVLDIVLEISLAFLEADLFADAAPGFLEDGPIFLADVAAKNAKESDKNTYQTEYNERRNTNHAIIITHF